MPETGLTALATSDGDQALADRVADEIAEPAWARRRDFSVRCAGPKMGA